MGLDHVSSEIERMRVQVGRQRKEILQLQRAGISTARLPVGHSNLSRATSVVSQATGGARKPDNR
ncbi:hypothetical protein V1290_000147 [Bradyrhizobium sp. AZCC 1578]